MIGVFLAAVLPSNFVIFDSLLLGVDTISVSPYAIEGMSCASIEVGLA
jgi:hypothetical protein